MFELTYYELRYSDNDDTEEVFARFYDLYNAGLVANNVNPPCGDWFVVEMQGCESTGELVDYISCAQI